MISISAAPERVMSMAPRERRIVLAGYGVMTGITLASGLVLLIPDLRLRAAGWWLLLAVGWWLYVARSRSRLRLAGQALCDPLTGLYNRRYLMARLAEEVARVDRYGGSLTLAVLDLDDFKAINDRHGHLHGDEALRGFGNAVRATLRKSDLAFRFGGEEFVILFPDTALPVAATALERLREHLSRPSFSGGLAQYPAEAVDSMALLHLADTRLSEAKPEGKGRVNTG